MPEPESPKTRKPHQKTAAKTTQATPLCHIHDRVLKRLVDDIRKNVCVPESESPLIEFEGKYYCLFHLPTKDKGKDGLKKFEEIFQARLEKVNKAAAEVEAEFPDDQTGQINGKRERNIKYDYR